MQKPNAFIKYLSLFLALLMGLSVFAAAVPAAAAERKEPTPIVYIIGRTSIYNHLSEPDKRQQVPDAGNDAIVDAVKEALPYVAKAVFLGQWDEYCDKAYDLLMQRFRSHLHLERRKHLPRLRQQ